jgi:hypothetical protein
MSKYWLAIGMLMVGSSLFTHITYGQLNQSGPLTGGITQNQNQIVLGPDETHDPKGYQKGEGFLPISQDQWRLFNQYGVPLKPDKLYVKIGCSHEDEDIISGLIPPSSNAHWQRLKVQVHRTASGSTLEVFYLEDKSGNIWSTRSYTVNGVDYPANSRASGGPAERIKLTPQHPPGPCLPPVPNTTPNAGTTGVLPFPTPPTFTADSAVNRSASTPKRTSRRPTGQKMNVFTRGV